MKVKETEARARSNRVIEIKECWVLVCVDNAGETGEQGQEHCEGEKHLPKWPLKGANPPKAPSTEGESEQGESQG